MLTFRPPSRRPLSARNGSVTWARVCEGVGTTSDSPSPRHWAELTEINQQVTKKDMALDTGHPSYLPCSWINSPANECFPIPVQLVCEYHIPWCSRRVVRNNAFAGRGYAGAQRQATEAVSKSSGTGVPKFVRIWNGPMSAEALSQRPGPGLIAVVHCTALQLQGISLAQASDRKVSIATH